MDIPEEAIAAFQEAWEAKRKEIGRGISPKGTKTRAGLEAALESIDVEQLTTVILRTELPGGIKVGHADKIAHAVKNWLAGKEET